jgi:hypothetical protein
MAFFTGLTVTVALEELGGRARAVGRLKSRAIDG